MTDEERDLIREIRKDPRAVERMKAKCRWERMSWLGVLRDWGDPRTWNEGEEAPEQP